MKTLTKAAMALMATAAGLPAAYAADEMASSRDNRGWYVGGELSYADGESELRNEPKLSENGVGFGVYGGYNFSDWFGLEGTSFQSDNMADDRSNLASAEFSTLSFMPKFTVNFNEKVGLYFKAGPTYVLYTEEYDDDYYYSWDDDADWSEVMLGAGLGLVFDIQNGVKMRLSYDHVSGTLDETWYDDNDTPSNRVDVTLGRFALGVHYQF